MAKQLGLHKVQGKVGEYSYYESKNGGSVIRGINKGMSSRVKTAQEYVNTRKNNAEFGMCGDFAGAIIKPVTLRWRFILDSIATGKMVKSLKSMIVLDNTGKWGQRSIKLTNYDEIRTNFNAFSKNEFPAEALLDLANAVTYDAATEKIGSSERVVISASTVDSLMAKGATGIASAVFAVKTTIPSFDNNAGVYTKAFTELAEVTALEIEEDLIAGAAKNIIVDDSDVCAVNPISSATNFGSLLVVLLPYRTIGGTNYTLQELCSAALVSVEAGTWE